MMVAMMKALLRYLGTLWVWTLLLTLLLCGGLWWAGPRLALDDWRPWQTLDARLLSSVLLLTAWAMLIGLSHWRRVLRRQRGLDPAGASAHAQRVAQREALGDMRQRFRAARKRLSGGRVFGWRRGQAWRESLPWFLLLGQPGCGKTSVLEYSGLALPLNRREDLLTTPPTRTDGVQWYFAEDGVVLDTAGSLLTHEDPQARWRWQALLNVLRDKRRGRPLNGVVACLPVSLLLGDDPAELSGFAHRLSARLHDIHQQLRCTVPVYLILTQADTLRGFNGFFCHLGESGTQEVLGVGISDDEQHLDGELFDAKFRGLLRHVHRQLVDRVHAERDTAHLTKLITFPGQLHALLQPLRQLLDTAFSGNRYQARTPLLGVYLTAAPHWTATAASTPKDASPDATLPRKNMPGTPDAAPAIRGRSSFITEVFSHVIFARAGLARLTPAEVRRNGWLQTAKVLGLMAVTGAVLSTWMHAWRDSRASLDNLDALGRQLSTARETPVAGDDPIHLLARLDSSYAATQVFSGTAATDWRVHTGLFQGDESLPSLEQAYRVELDQSLLPAITQVLAGELRGALEYPASLRKSLGLYLMLNDRQHRDNEQLRDHLLQRWATRYPAQTQERQRLAEHLDRLLQRPFSAALNPPLIEQARNLLRARHDAQAVYDRLKDEARGLADFRFNRHLDRNGLLFSGTDLTLPGLYTRDGYQQVFLGKGPALVQDSLRDDWVLGGSDLPDPRRLRERMLELEALYLHDYAQHWGEALGQIDLLPLDSAAQGAEQAAALTAPDSPLIALLNTVRDHTRLPLAQEHIPPSPDLNGAAAVVNAVAKEAVAAALPDRAKRALAQRFADLHRLLDDDGGPSADMIAALQALNGLHLQLGPLGRASQPEQAAFELAKGRMDGALDGFSAVRSSSARLPLPLRDWLTHLADDSWQRVLDEAYRHVNERYQDELFKPYEQTLARRYPFNGESENEVQLLDFQAFFKRNGQVDTFLDRYLTPFVNASQHEYRLRSVGGRTLPVSAHTLKQLARAQQIQRSFFAQSPDRLGVAFRLEPYTLDAVLSRATFSLGDAQLEYRHGPVTSRAFTWPTEAQNGLASLVTQRHDGKAIGFQENTGPWSLFHLLERMETAPHRGQDVVVLKADVAGARVNYLLSTHLPNAFDTRVLRGFALPMAL